MNYKKLVRKIEDNGCKLDWLESDFKENYKNEKSNINIISQCGHNTSVQLSNFLYKKTGQINCRDCMFKQQSLDQKGISKDSFIQEFNVINAIQTYFKDKFIVSILPEGSKADMALKPIDCVIDSWLPIQVKTNKALSHGIYSFAIKNQYENMLLLLFNVEEQRIWILDGNDVSIKKINIGYQKSVYSKYEKTPIELGEYLTENYNNNDNMNQKLEYFAEGISDQIKNETEFRIYREKTFPQLNITYPIVYYRVYDAIINNSYKIQDKVITEYYHLKTNNKDERREKPAYVINLLSGNHMYKLDDNDYYWFHLPDKSGAYIVPENILYENEYIADRGVNVTKKMLSLYPYHTKEQLENIKTAWMNDHLYIYKKDVEKIINLFPPRNKPIETYINSIIIKDRYNEVKVLVNNIFAKIKKNYN